jgi:mRNA interferase RelE/StbE
MIVILSLRAEKQLRKITKIDQLALANKIRSISDNSSKTKAEKLVGLKDIYRVRVGNYRIVYRQYVSKIYIVLISHRRDIYRLLGQIVK